MKVCGIVCEYNPFHTGHQFHIQQTRNHADAVVCVMSGNFVQRGEPAIIRKHIRAEAAVRGGADLVIELPSPWAVSSAEHFASGAISLLTSIKNLSMISFGAETNRIDLFQKTAVLLQKDSFSERLKLHLTQGISFASAREKAVSEISEECAAILREPNNILAVEYLKALQDKPEIEILAIKRQGANHDDKATCDGFASASYLRNEWKNGKFDKLGQYLPTHNTFIEEIHCQRAPVTIDLIDRGMLAVLKQMTAEDYLKFADLSEGLHIRIKRAIDQATTLDEAIELAKSKRYAHARLRRIFLNAFLGIPADFCKQKPPYLRILAFNDTGRSLLSDIKTELPVITKPAKANNLSGFAKEVFELEAKATNLYSLAMPKPMSGQQEWQISPIYIPGNHKTV